MIEFFLLVSRYVSLLAPNLLANRVSYHLMRQSLKPLWEDEENKKLDFDCHFRDETRKMKDFAFGSILVAASTHIVVKRIKRIRCGSNFVWQRSVNSFPISRGTMLLESPFNHVKPVKTSCKSGIAIRARKHKQQSIRKCLVSFLEQLSPWNFTKPIRPTPNSKANINDARKSDGFLPEENETDFFLSILTGTVFVSKKCFFFV